VDILGRFRFLERQGAPLVDFNLNVDPQVFALVTGVVLPLLVGLITKYDASPRVKALLLALLAGVSGALASLNSSEPVISGETLTQVAISWVTAILVYFGFWKPTGVTETLNWATRNFGFGPKPVNPLVDIITTSSTSAAGTSTFTPIDPDQHEGPTPTRPQA
jgi:hypothetical protein